MNNLHFILQQLKMLRALQRLCDNSLFLYSYIPVYIDACFICLLGQHTDVSSSCFTKS